MPFPIYERWAECLYWPERLKQDQKLVSDSAKRLTHEYPDLKVRLACGTDGPCIETLERIGFKHLPRVRRSADHLYDGDWLCENRMGPVLKVVCENDHGVCAFGIAQIRHHEMYSYEIAAAPACRKPGQAIFRTFIEIARLLEKPIVTAMLSRNDTRQAMLRLSARMGMYPAVTRGFTLDGALQKPEWTWLTGQTNDICVAA